MTENEIDKRPDPVAESAAAKTIAENEKAVAEARAGAWRSWLPTPRATALDGTVTVAEGAGTVGANAALKLLHEAAAAIAASVVAAPQDGNPVVVVDGADLAAGDWIHAAVGVELRGARGAAERLVAELRARCDGDRSATEDDGGGTTPEGLAVGGGQPETIVGAALPAAAAVAQVGASALSALIGSAADAASYFRGNYDIGAVGVTRTSTPLVAAVASELVRNGIRTRVDGLSLFDPETGTMKAFAELRAARDDLGDAHVRAATRLAARTAAGVEPERLAALQDALAAATALEVRIDAQVVALTTVAEGKSMPPLALAALRDGLHRADQPVRVLAVSIDHLAVDAIRRRALFGRARIVFAAAAHVSAMLREPGGDVIAASTFAGESRTLLYLKSGVVEEAARSHTGLEEQVARMRYAVTGGANPPPPESLSPAPPFAPLPPAKEGTPHRAIE